MAPIELLIAELREEFQRQVESLSLRIKTLEERAAPSALSSPETVESLAENAAGQTTRAITPETLALITETITALIGRKVHVRSVKVLPTPPALANPWAQHGRAVVQASHNFTSRKREP
jgi:hypothetical protein